MKRIGISMVLFGLLLFVGSCLAGCGNPTGGGGGGASGMIPNTGTISGKIYTWDRTTSTYITISDAYVSVSAESMTSEVTVKVDPNGYYILSGLPAGEVELTVTRDAYNKVQTISCNSNKINFAIGNTGTTPAGSVTLRGTAEGYAANPDSGQIDAFYLSHDRYLSNMTYFDSSTGTFEISGVGPNETVYVETEFGYSSEHPYSQYNTINTSSSPIQYVFLPNDCCKTIEATTILPSGYSNSSASVDIGRGHNTNCEVWWNDTSANPIIMSQLPTLKSGDSYGAHIYAVDAINNNRYNKSFANRSDGSQFFDMTSDALPTTSFIMHPASGETITASTTFEWQSVGWATYYLVSVSEYSTLPGGFSWSAYTNGTKISIPPVVFNMMPSGNYRYTVNAYKMVNFPGIYQMNVVADNSYTESFLGNNDELILNKP